MSNDQQAKDSIKFSGNNAAAQSTDILCSRTIQELLTMDRPDEDPGSFFLEMIADFESLVDTNLTRLNSAATKNCTRDIEHISHKLKGISRNVGAKLVANTCENLETKARSQSLNENADSTLILNSLSEAVGITKMHFSQLKEQVSSSNHQEQGSGINKLTPAPIKSTTDLKVFGDDFYHIQPPSIEHRNSTAFGRERNSNSDTDAASVSNEPNDENTEFSHDIKLITDNLHDQAVFETDCRGHIILWNKNSQRITGYPSEQVLGKHISIFYQEHDISQNLPQQNLAMALNQGKFECEAIRIKNGGARYWAHIVIIPKFDVSGTHIGFINYRRDVTASKATEMELARTRQKFYEFFRNSHDGIIFLENNANSLEFNPAFCKLLGYSKEELLNPDTFASIRSARDRASDNETALQVSHTGVSVQFERTFIHKFGEMIPTHVTFFKIDAGESDLNSVAAIVRDIRDQIQAREHIIHARQQALNALQAKGEFLAKISHEIRTPLNGIIGLTSLLERLPLQPEASEYIEGIRCSGEHLLSLVNEVLDFSRIESGKMTLETIAFDPRMIVDEVCGLFAAEARKKSLTLNSSIEPSVAHAIFGDPTKIRQILFNLISNAIKFTTKGSVSVHVSVIGESKGHQQRLRFEIIDTGLGISSEQLSNLFQPFTQADNSTTRKYGGTGLGLVITKGLSELMGGDIQVQSHPNQGSKFSFIANFQMNSAAILQDSKPKLNVNIENVVISNATEQTILVVDDNQINQKVAARMLEKLGLKCDVASNGLEAVSAVKNRDYSAILMDCLMPEMDGYSATMAIRSLGARHATIPIIAMTANARKSDQERCFNVGMNDYIEKPVRIEDLALTIKRSLEKRRM